MDNEKIEFLKNSDYRGILCDSACDFSLPDYKGDVKRVLHTKVSVIPSGKFMDNGEVSASGIVLYNVIYLNSDNKIEGIEFNSDYDFNYKCPLDNAQELYVDTRVSSSSVRLTGPRRFSAKCSLTSDISILDMCSLESDIENSADAELKKESILVMSRHAYTLGEREYAEKILSLDGVIADDVNIISKDAYISVSSVSGVGDAAVVKGNILVDTVISIADVPAYTEHKVIPFEESVDISGGKYAHFDAKGRVTSLAISVNAEDFSSEVVANVIAELDVFCTQNSELTVASDGYCLSCAAEPSYEKLSYNEFLDSQSKDERIELRIPLSDITDMSVREIISISGDVRSESITPAQKGMSVDAELRIFGVVCATEESGELSYSGFKHSAPISLNVNLNCQKYTDFAPKVEISLSDFSAVTDHDAIVVSCNAHIYTEITQTKFQKRLVKMNPDDSVKFEKCASKITVYYPEAGEDVFSVAKKFHTTVKEIAVNNALTESVLNPIDGTSARLGRLIIR